MSTPQNDSPGLCAAAIAYLRSRGVVIEDAPLKWRRRGFRFYAPTVGQMLTADDLQTFARNERDLAS